MERDTMSNEIKTQAAPIASAVAVKDLSQAIEGSIAREPGEEVRSVRVFDDNYRCNWWVRDAAPGPMYLNTGRIIKSKFIRATMSGEKLIIEELGR
jgi:hypothetical protein